MAKKTFAQLSESGKAARLAKYAAARKQYGLLNGLFNVTAIADHGVISTKRGNCYKFGYRMVPAGDNNEEGIKQGDFFWMNELINLKGNAKKIVALRQAWANQLSNTARKSILVSVNYKHVGNYRDVHDMHVRARHHASK